MRINHNLASMNTYRQFNSNQTRLSKSLEKLSSGLRINRSADDAAGLAISEKMRNQIRGLSQASRNVQDGISLTQTADGGLNEVHSLLQRGRELAVQANNDTLVDSDKQKIQGEIEQIKKEVDRIANNTTFNTIHILNSSAVSATDMQTVLDNLQKGWLAASEDLVESTFGITGGGANLEIVLDSSLDGAGGTLAQVQFSYMPGSPGTGTNLSLHIDMTDFTNTTYPDDSSLWISSDRIIAHEMTHAVMAASINVADGMQTWFMEGTAEAVQGADERLKITLSGMSVQQMADRMGTGTSGWGGTSDDYSMAYSAIRYMDYLIGSNGGAGVKDILQAMAAAPTSMTLDQAIAGNAALASAGVTSIADFAAKFRSSAAGGGVEYINNVLVPNLSNADTGALTGSDRGNSLSLGGTDIGNNDIVDETPYGTITTDPLQNFNEIWPTSTSSMGKTIHIQAGANSGETILIDTVDVRSASIGIAGADVTTSAGAAISSFDQAIETVSTYRSTFGAKQNQLEHAMANVENSHENLTASESRIRDIDMAKEMMQFTKDNVLRQAAQAMLAQANQIPEGMLQLLRV